MLQYTIYIMPLILTAILSVGLSWYAYNQRPTQGALSLAALMFIVAEWSLCYALEIASVELSAKLFWGKLQYIGITTAPVALLTFALQYSQYNNLLTWRKMLLLLLIPAITVLLALTNEQHGLIWSNTVLDRSGPFVAVSVTYGQWFWVHLIYSYVLLLCSTLLIIFVFTRRRLVYRRQAAVVIMAVGIPWLGNILYFSGLNPITQLDLTPFALALTGIMFAWGIFGFRLLDLTPIARAAVLEGMRDGVMVLDARGRITDMNPVAATMIGQTLGQVLGQPASIVLDSQLDLPLEPQNDPVAEMQFTLGQGEARRNIEARVSLLRDREARSIGCLLVLRDVTEAKRAEEERQKLTALIEYSADFIGMTDLDGQIIFLNASGRQLVGLPSAEEARTKWACDLILESDLPLFRTEIVPLVRREGAWNGEINLRHFDGSRSIPMQFSAFVVRNSYTGEPLAFASVSRDITERKRAEQLLHRQAEQIADQHQRLQVIISASRDGVVLISEYRRILVANESALRLLHLPGQPSDWLEQPLNAMLELLLQTEPALAATAVAELHRVMNGDYQPSEGEYELGAAIVHWQNLPVQADTIKAGRLLVLREVTEERKIERMRNDLTHTMVHDLRNPLTAIQVSLDVLSMIHVDEGDGHDLLQIASRSSRRLLNLVNAILDLSRLESGQMPLQPTMLTLPTMIADIFQLLAPLAHAKGQHTRFQVPAELPNVVADGDLIGRVLQNLIGNAIKFTPEGGTITTIVRMYADLPQYVQVSVNDTGPGVPDDIHARLFQKFVTGSNREQGSGLGLAFCRLVIEAHGGRIWLDLDRGPGTTFSFILPAT